MRILPFLAILFFITRVSAQTKGGELEVEANCKPVNLDNKIALVIGNQDYVSNRLNNPLNDAKKVAETLRNCGFTVLYKTNLDRKGMNAIINQFGDSVKKRPGISLFYYSGHGIQHKSENYLLPVDLVLTSKSEVEDEAVKMNKVLHKMREAKGSMNIVILDACRNAPLPADNAGTKQGLSDLDDAPDNTLIFFATSPNKVALDGLDENSPFTKALVNQINGDTVELFQIAKRVIREVKAETKNAQTPWLVGSTDNDFYFKTRPFRKPDLFIVSIGISNYIQNSLDLQYGSKSAFDFTRIIKSRARSNQYNSVRDFTLSNEAATGKNIYAMIRQVQKQVQEGDVILMYFNGHIVLDNQFDAYILPHEGDPDRAASTGVGYNELFSLLTKLPCKSLLFLDAVHPELDSLEKIESYKLAEGAITRSVYLDDLNGLTVTDTVKKYDLTEQGSNVVVLSATSGMQYAFESSQHNTTAYLYGLFNALENTRSCIDVETLLNAMKESTEKLTGGRQKPRIRIPKGWQNFTLFEDE
jgi:uncharacterized caspase-like protein